MKYLVCKRLLAGLLVMFMAGCYQGGDAPTNTGTGVGGSTARFTIQKNHLITIEDHQVKVFSLSQPMTPVNVATFDTRITMETIFPQGEERIYIGTNEGTIIMDHQEAGILQEVAFVAHFRSCDPVVADGHYMYVTLRDGNGCGVLTSNVNQLMVFDIADVKHPELITQININRPYGLGIRADSLFVCYANGVLQYDISEPRNIEQVAGYSTQCDDLIAATDPMIFTSAEGIHLVTHSDAGLTEQAIIRAGD